MYVIRCLVVLVLLWGCAPDSQGVTPGPAEIPPVPAGKARIFAYQEPQGFLLGYLPPVPVRIDKVVVGKFPPDSAMFWDVAPGRHELDIAPAFAERWGIEIVRGEVLRLAAGEEAFISIMLQYNRGPLTPACPSRRCVWVEIQTDPDRQELAKDRIRRPVYNIPE